MRGGEGGIPGLNSVTVSVALLCLRRGLLEQGVDGGVAGARRRRWATITGITI
jgi:hypothetical protein